MKFVLGVFNLVGTLDLSKRGKIEGKVLDGIFYWKILEVDSFLAVFGFFTLMGVRQLEKKGSFVQIEYLWWLQEFWEVFVVNVKERKAAGETRFVVSCKSDVLNTCVISKSFLYCLLISLRAESSHKKGRKIHVLVLFRCSGTFHFELWNVLFLWKNLG